MKLIIIIGNAAVGKMTVGQELTKITDLRLFHNHMSIEPIIEIFGEYNKNAIGRFRQVVFDEFVKTDNEGMIFTYMWDFNLQSEWDYIDNLSNLFKDNGGQVYYVELIAPQEIRLQRNVTENRLQHKASKRDIEASNKRVTDADEKHRCVSHEGEITFDNYLRIDNSNIAPKDVAQLIKTEFDL